MNFQALHTLSNKEMARGIPKLVHPKKTCAGYLLSKQVRSSFPSKADFMVKEKLELVHADLCGPMSPPTPRGNRYMFLLVDDYSRAMWVFMLKTKDQALDAFKNFKALVEKKANDTIKTLRTDRGGEFTSREFEDFCASVGIRRHLTAPYNPQQNGLVERRNRTVIAMTRSFLKEKNLPPTLWGEAVRHSVYILNRLPIKALLGETPYEAWSGVKPKIDHIHIFGCLAHVKVPTVRLGKLDDRSEVMVYIGKEPGTKAHRLYNPNTDRLHVSRDVVFEEGKGWDWQKPKVQGNSEFGTFIVMDTQVDTHEHDDIEISSPSTPSPMASAFQESGNTGHNSGPTAEYSSESSANSSAPREFRLLSEIYEETE